MSMLYSRFIFNIPTRVEYGVDVFNFIGLFAKKYGRKALIVSTSGQSLKGMQQRCQKLLKEEGLDSVVFRGVKTNPSYKTVDECSSFSERERCDLIIGLGGGSAIDVAKAVAVSLTERTGIWEIVEGRKITTKPLPLIAVPTTSGTGSEVTQYAVISNPEKKQKEGVGKPEFYPVLSVVDPSLTLSMPSELTAAVGLDALTHAIEAYTTKFADPISDILAEKAIRLISQSLRRAVFSPKDIIARSDMMLASMLAGMAITHADTSLAHVIGEAVGAVFDVHHGLAVSLTLPSVMEYNCFSNLEKFKRIAELMGKRVKGLAVREAAMLAPEAVRNLIYDLGVPRGLAALGVRNDPHIMYLCTRPGADQANIRPAGEKDFEMIIDGSMSHKMSLWAE